MKTALCLYGQPRNINQKINQIIQNVVEPNNCDVFVHAWFDSSDRNIKKLCPGYEHRQLEANTENILLNLNPKENLIESQKEFNNPHIPQITEYNIKKCFDYGMKYALNDFSKNTIFRCYSMWYSIYQSDMLRQLYELKTGIKYDCVIRMRYDNTPNARLLVQNYDLNYYYNYDVNQPEPLVNDWFNFSNSYNMSVSSSLFIHIERLIKECLDEHKYWCNELLLYQHLRNNNVNVKKFLCECSW
jgi:hypothetical protein